MLENYYTKAYAKVNFNLRVFPKQNGQLYHKIESVFQTINLYDELFVCIKEEKGCSVQCDSLVLPEKNTLTSAYEAFCKISGCDVPGINVKLVKGIPSGGGLGGGSSDAAALIRVLSDICGISLNDSQLDFIAENTGSDVFFFMHCDSEGKGAALVTGRGEIIKKIESRKDLFLLLIFPKIASSTKEAYSLVDKSFETKDSLEHKVKYPVFNSLESVYADKVINWTFVNTFTEPLSQKYSDIFEALKDLRNSGAEFIDMSGSGSTVFGVFTLRQQAIYTSNLLADKWKCKLVQTL